MKKNGELVPSIAEVNLKITNSKKLKELQKTTIKKAARPKIEIIEAPKDGPLNSIKSKLLTKPIATWKRLPKKGFQIASGAILITGLATFYIVMLAYERDEKRRYKNQVSDELSR